MFVNVTWDNWVNVMSWQDRASAVAHYRLNLLIKAHVEDAHTRAAEREARRQAARHRSRAN